MKRLPLYFLALALPIGAGATPTVSGDGACGVRAVDNESFLTCEGDRAPEPAAPMRARPVGEPDDASVVTYSCRFVEAAERPRRQGAPSDEVLLRCRTDGASRVAFARP